MKLFGALDISGSALAAQRTRMDVIAENIANAETTRTPEGGPYRRKQVVLAQIVETARTVGRPAGGVQVVGIVLDPLPPKQLYAPSHPDADEQGYVQMPNVDVPTEMVDMIAASRAYEANAKVLRTGREMVQDALNIMS